MQKLTIILNVDGIQGRDVVALAAGLGSQKNRALKSDNLDAPTNMKSGGHEQKWQA